MHRQRNWWSGRESIFASICGNIMVLLLLLPGAAGAVQPIDQVTDLEWSPEHRVYVKGNLPEHADAFQRMEEGLAGTCTTVVISKVTTDEKFHTPDGRPLEGHAAADMFIGHGLFNQSAFKDQVDAPSGMACGSAILITFDESDQ